MQDIVECPKCHARLIVSEHSGGAPGGKEREYGYFPQCSTEVANVVTSGIISVRLADDSKR